jgi:hypothetical protein
MSDENTESIMQVLSVLSDKVDANTQEQIKLNEEQAKFNQKMDERFYQLSKDTLGFARNVIVTAAVVAVLAPLLKESLTFALDLLKQSS